MSAQSQPSVSIGGDLSVSRIGLGTMSLTGPGTWGEPPDPDEAASLLRRAVELGVQLIDSADSYGPDVAERLVSVALHPYPDLLVATKGGLVRDGPGAWRREARPEHLRAACEGSLRRLRLERIDLYQLHAVDPDVPLEESLGALVELRAEGKIRHIGLCNVSPAELERACAACPVVSVQNRYNAADRSSAAVLAACERRGLAFIAWAPLARGRLIGGGGALRRIADSRGVAPGQVALAWLLGRSPVLVPIPGTSSLRHLEENVASAALRLGVDDVARLDRQSFVALRLRQRGRRARVLAGRLRRRLA